MSIKLASAVSILHVIVCRSAGSAEGFLKLDTPGGAVDSDAAFKQAMSSLMACDASRGSSLEQRLAQVERAVSPMWRALPKSGKGRVEWKTLRYLTHRYFMQQSSLLIRGLEPARQINDTHAGVAEILNKHAPSLLQTVLEGKSSSGGYSLEDAVALIGAMEQLIFDSEGALLEKAYKLFGMPVQWRLTKRDLLDVLEAYFLLWMLGDDAEKFSIMSGPDRKELEAAIPHWNSISDMIGGLITSMEFSRQHRLQSGHWHLLMMNTFSFEDAHEVVGALSKTFASYWESECQAIKASLESIDYSGTGRVKLSDFYGAKLDGEERFAESEAYLRQLGAVDESSTWKGKQVIIPNYLHGVSNCIVTFEHYYVCCVNECEGVLSEIESAVGSPLAAPGEIFHTLANITTFDDEASKLTAMLKQQLERIATTHAGQVPLHGRLFAQWLHYVFPRECPFPHKTRSIYAVSPMSSAAEFASDEEVQSHAAIRNITMKEVSALEEAQLLSQWSEEEELPADYSSLVQTPWQNLRVVLLSIFGGCFLVGLRSKMASSSKPTGPMNHGFHHHHTKVHIV